VTIRLNDRAAFKAVEPATRVHIVLTMIEQVDPDTLTEQMA
jgi:hypothetical protein